MDRLDFFHAIFYRALGGKLYLAPLKQDKVQHVLDMGTGTGLCKPSACHVNFRLLANET